MSICFVDSHGALPRLVESASKGMFRNSQCIDGGMTARNSFFWNDLGSFSMLSCVSGCAE